MPADAQLQSLVLAARRGDQAAWDALVTQFTPLLWAVARGHGLPVAAAVDVAHTTWLRLVEGLDDVVAERLGVWVATVARRESLQALRWVDPRPGRTPRTGERDPLWAAVDQLPPRCRLALRVLAVGPAIGTAELAAALNIPPTQADSFADESLGRLADALASDTPT